jgi:hypothetical protein
MNLIFHSLVGFVSCLLETITDKRAPMVGRCYQLNQRVSNAYLRRNPPVTTHSKNSEPTIEQLKELYEQTFAVDCLIDSKSVGSLLVTKIKFGNDPTWAQWVECIYCNDKNVMYKGWLPRWEFIQIVIPNSSKERKVAENVYFTPSK